MQGPHLPSWQNLPGGPPDADRWRLCELQGFDDAERLLDLLERCGVAEREVVLHEGRFAVRWRPSVAPVPLSPGTPGERG